MTEKARLNTICTAIGRGHPFYLDGIISTLNILYPNQIDFQVENVFTLSSGIARISWRMVRALYRQGSQSGIIGNLYSRIRRRDRPYALGAVEKMLARDLRGYLEKNRGLPVLVNHPLLVPMLADLVPVYYQHGEAVVPAEAAVEGAAGVFVPLEETKALFMQQGIASESIIVSGLCVEPGLAPEAALLAAKRKVRLAESSTLVGAFYSSGAEPHRHVGQIISCLKSLERASQRAVVFCQAGGRLENRLIHETGARRIFPDKKGGAFHESFEKNNIMAVICNNRFQEEEYTARLFRYFDYLVAPSHERTNWALGLGLPMFILGPCIGPFSPLNRDFLLKKGVGLEISSIGAAGDFADKLREIQKDGKLLSMSERGFGGYDINGFKNIADYLLKSLPVCKA